MCHIVSVNVVVGNIASDKMDMYGAVNYPILCTHWPAVCFTLHLALKFTANEWSRHWIVGTLWPKCNQKSSSCACNTLGHSDPYIPINQANTGSVTNAQDTVRVAIGVSLRVKNKRDQNWWNIYELYRRYIIVVKQTFLGHSNFILCMLSLKMPPPPPPPSVSNFEKNGPLVCHYHCMKNRNYEKLVKYIGFENEYVYRCWTTIV